MTPNNHDDLSNDLGRALHDRADGMVGAPITLSDVKGKATRIRRRRAIAASAAVAAAVAIIVPTALSGSDLFDDSSSDGKDQIATNTPNPTETGGTAQSWPQALDTSDLGLGEAPKVTWFEGTTMHTPEGDIELPNDYAQVVRYDDGWMALDFSTGTIVQLDAEGNLLRETKGGQGLAISSDGSEVLYANGVGLNVHNNETGVDTLMGSVDGLTTEPVAIEDGIAYYNVESGSFPQDGRWSAVGEGVEHDPTPGSLQPWNSIASDGTSVGYSSIDDFGTCSTLRGRVPDAEVLGETCDFTLEKFSPDGEHLILAPAYGDGFGATEIGVLPADGEAIEDGQVLFHYSGTSDADPTFMDAAWEDDEHLLVVTYLATPGVNQSTWVILRLGLDGSVEKAVEPVVTKPAFEPSTNPFSLG